jgi:hypothetical protein
MEKIIDLWSYGVVHKKKQRNFLTSASSPSIIACYKPPVGASNTAMPLPGPVV